MPIIFTGKKICEKCGKTFEWCNYEPLKQRLGVRLLIVEDEVKNYAIAHEFTKIENAVYTVAVNCTHCNYDNVFVFHDNED